MSADVRGRIVLHVGAPKTGSTYLQRRLRSEPDALRAQGIYVPIMQIVENIAGNAKLLATALSDEPSLTFKRIFPQIDLQNINQCEIVTELLSGWSAGREMIILSAENFRPSHAMRMRELLPAEHDVRVVLFVRRQDIWVESYYNQLIKTGDIRCSITEFVDNVFDRQSDRLCYPNWEEHFTAWNSIFGDCRLVFFEEARENLFAAFCAAAGLAFVPQVMEIAPQQLSLNNYQLCYLASLPPNITHTEFEARRRADHIAAFETDAPPPPQGRLLDAKLYSRIVSRFAPSNNRLIQILASNDCPSRLAFPRQHVGHLPIEEIVSSEGFRDHCRRADANYKRSFC